MRSSTRLIFIFAHHMISLRKVRIDSISTELNDKVNDTHTRIPTQRCNVRSKIECLTNSACRISYHILLHSSKTQEPRCPSLKVVLRFCIRNFETGCHLLAQVTLFLQFVGNGTVVMILPQVHLRKPCYDFTFL